MKRRLLVILIGGLLLGADAPKSANKDHKQIRGIWKVVTSEKNGKKEKTKFTHPKQIIKADKITFLGPDGKERLDFYLSYKLDTTKNPKHIDMTNEMTMQTVLGIYTLDGDSLRICAAPPGVDRPKEFKTTEGSGLGLMVFKREKR